MLEGAHALIVVEAVEELESLVDPGLACVVGG
jgi:hypothetical protein